MTLLAQRYRLVLGRSAVAQSARAGVCDANVTGTVERREKTSYGCVRSKFVVPSDP